MNNDLTRIAELCEMEEPEGVRTTLHISNICHEVWIMAVDEDGKCRMKSHFARYEREGDEWYEGLDSTPATTADVIRELEAVRNA